MRKYLSVLAVFGAIALADCAGFQPPGTTFIRADGQDIDAEQLAADREVCIAGHDKLEDCMSGKGYALVRDEEVAAKQKEFAEAAEKKKQEELARAAVEKKKKTALGKKVAKKNVKTKGVAPAGAVAQPTSVSTSNAMPATPTQQQTTSGQEPRLEGSSQALPWPQR